ncbi:glutathione hydrolase 1 proenzyme-like isoform X2 [Megalobrama amblycephala]|uniref:glutathione hydrolase 1 proenzyme-like isoform X2 n=1 Tax=Megalobrama amblycephala TaxID=75352 RepID=UPI00201404AB|nr:glutathione hydrolase 1 proenzyme-like isoform X2 [Megalobrama amblycephala]XP_048051607.1 glutathione hydrolase 1 proenzyme-like isoform X2 [Megalobrama amblycephala]
MGCLTSKSRERSEAPGPTGVSVTSDGPVTSDPLIAQRSDLPGISAASTEPPPRPSLSKKWCLPLIAGLVISGVVVLIFYSINSRHHDKCYSEAAVAADAGTCSKIGSDMLKRNGSAVDAAIAALLCVSLVNAQSMGIGGGVVFTIYDPSTGKVETINARETAPMSASENMFGNDPEKAKPGLFIAVPGELRGYEMAHKRHGRLQWKELFEPTIKLSLDGFRIGKALARAISEESGTILNDKTLCEVFCDSNNKTLKENDIIRFPKLADTYKKIAEEGPDAFYSGSLTQTIVEDINAAGGIITREDLKNYEAVLNEYALNFTVGNYTFHAPDAPFGGPVLALILNILKGYNISSSSVFTIKNKTLMYHRMIEAFRFADAQKSKLGDPRVNKKINEIVKNMTSVSFADHIRSKIKDDYKQNSYYEQEGIDKVPYDHGTSHLSVIAEDGSAVAVTSSINDYFGSGVMSHSTGIIFNNQMRDFLDPEVINGISENNLIQPGKRPLSSKCPTIILDNQSRKVKMVVGGAGGTNITTSVAQVILNYLFFDYDLKRSVNEPRVQITLNATNIEDDFNKKHYQWSRQSYDRGTKSVLNPTAGIMALLLDTERCSCDHAAVEPQKVKLLSSDRSRLVCWDTIKLGIQSNYS